MAVIVDISIPSRWSQTTLFEGLPSDTVGYNDRRGVFNYKYSQASNSFFCYTCQHFSLPLSVFIEFNNWKKKVMFTDGGLAAHAKSEPHFNAVFAWAEYEKLLKVKNPSQPHWVHILRKCNKKYIKSVAPHSHTEHGPERTPWKWRAQ